MVRKELPGQLRFATGEHKENPHDKTDIRVVLHARGRGDCPPENRSATTNDWVSGVKGGLVGATNTRDAFILESAFRISILGPG